MNPAVKKALTFTLPLVTLTEALVACPRCRAQAAAGIYNSDFEFNFFFMLLPLLILMTLGLGFYYVDDFPKKSRRK